jgi:hypothetical protein
VYQNASAVVNQSKSFFVESPLCDPVREVCYLQWASIYAENSARITAILYGSRSGFNNIPAHPSTPPIAFLMQNNTWSVHLVCARGLCT